MEPTMLQGGDASGKPKSGETSPSHTFLGTEMRRDHESVDDFEHLDPESSPVKETVGDVKSDSLDKLVLLDPQDTETTACSSSVEVNNSTGFSIISEPKLDHSSGNASPSLLEGKFPNNLSGSDTNIFDASEDAKTEIEKNTKELSQGEVEDDHDVMKALDDLPRPPTSFGSIPDPKHDDHEPEVDPIHIDNLAANVSSSDYSMPVPKNENPQEAPLLTFESPPIAPVSSISSVKREELVAEERDLSDKDDDSSFVMAQRDHFYDKNSTEDLLNLSNEASSNVMPSAPMEELPPEPVYPASKSGLTDALEDFHSDEEPSHFQEAKPDVISISKPTDLGVGLDTPFVASKESPDDKNFSLLSSPCSWFKPEKLNPRVVQLVYWRNPKESGAVFGSILAILLSLSYFSLISVVAYLSLSVLCVTLSIRVYKSVLQAIQKNQDGHPFKDILEMDLTMSEERVQEVTRTVVAHVNAAVTELRRLFLVEDLVDSLKFGVCVWCLTYVGAWFNGMTLIIIAFVGLFTLPKGYENNKAQVDQNLELINKKLSEISAKVKAAIPIGKKDKPKEQ